MKKIIISMALLSFSIFNIASPNPLPPTFITEFSTNPVWVEVYSIIDVDLSNCIIRTSSDSARVNSGVTLEAGVYLILDQNNTSGFTLNPSGDEIEICGNDVFVYGPSYGIHGYDAAPLPNESAVDFYEGHGNFNFQPYPNPGERDFSVAGWTWNDTTISINEVSPRCTWNDNCGYVELYNSSDNTVDISGYQIICNSRLIIAEGTVMAGLSFYILDQARYPQDFSPGVSEDNIYLLDNFGVLLDEVGWSSDHGENISFGLSPDGQVHWRPDWEGDGFWWGFNDQTLARAYNDGFPSRGAYNRAESPGLKVIGIRAEVIDNVANIFWTNPIWLSVFNTAILRKSYDGFPMTPFDGDIVYEGPDQQYLGDIVPQNQIAYYTVFARTGCGEYSIPDSESQIMVTGTTGIGNDNQVPDKISSISSYPNPFNAETVLNYSTVSSGTVKLNIYNLCGQKIITLIDGNQNAGEHRIKWNASNFPSGVYFAWIECGGRSNSTKMLLLK